MAGFISTSTGSWPETDKIKLLWNCFPSFNNEDYNDMKDKSLDEIIDSEVNKLRDLVPEMVAKEIISGLNNNLEETISVYSVIYKSTHTGKISDKEIICRYSIDRNWIEAETFPIYIPYEDFQKQYRSKISSVKQDALLQWEIKNIEMYLQKLDEGKLDGLKDKGIPRRYSDASFDTYKPETENNARNLEEIRKYSGMKDNDQVLLIFGPSGVGKTHLACAVLRDHLGLYSKYADIATEFEEAKDFKSKVKNSDLMRKYTSQPMLVIDEVGKSDKPDKGFDLLEQILNSRYENKLPTVIVSSLKKMDLAGKLNRKTLDILIETAAVLEFDGKSFRKPKRKDAPPSYRNMQEEIGMDVRLHQLPSI